MIKAALWALLISLFPLLISPATAQMCGGGEMDGLVGYWNFDEGSGGTAHDVSGNGLDGTITGASWISGHVGSGALSFDGYGSSDHVSAPAPFDTEPDSFTMSAWFRPEGWGENQSGVIAELHVGTSTRAHIRMLNGSGEQGLRAFVRLTGNPDISINAPGVPVTFGTWHHVALVVESDRSESRLYLNGVEIGQGLGASATNTMVSGAQTLVGRGNLANRHFEGAIDEVMIFDHALSASEVQKLMVPGEAGDMLYNPDHGTIQWCDGETWIGLPKPGDESGWLVISAGDAHACGVRSDGSAWCWGSAGSGRLGNGEDSGNEDVPVRVGLEAEDTLWNDWVTISAGTNFSCGVRQNGSAWCWGGNANSRLGAGGGIGQFSTTLRLVGGGSPFYDWVEIKTGGAFACGRRQNGTVWCWGYGVQGQPGDGTTSQRSTPHQVGTADTDTLWSDWVGLTVGGRHVCGVRSNGTAWCWGEGNRGERGDGTTETVQSVPIQVGTADSDTLWSDWVGIRAGGSFTCGTRTDGSAWCWGRGNRGQLGNGSEDDSNIPVRVGTAGSDTLWNDWVDVLVGDAHSCGLRTGGTVWCWGWGASGKRGDGSTTANQSTPVQVGTIGTGTQWSDWLSLATMSRGNNHACGIRVDGSAWCWGLGSSGQRGDGTSSSTQTVPSEVSFETTDQCNDPDGEAGDMLYSPDHGTIQWCDGEQWIGLPKSNYPIVQFQAESDPGNPSFVLDSPVPQAGEWVYIYVMARRSSPIDTSQTGWQHVISGSMTGGETGDTYQWAVFKAEGDGVRTSWGVGGLTTHNRRAAAIYHLRNVTGVVTSAQVASDTGSASNPIIADIPTAVVDAGDAVLTFLSRRGQNDDDAGFSTPWHLDAKDVQAGATSTSGTTIVAGHVVAESAGSLDGHVSYNRGHNWHREWQMASIVVQGSGHGSGAGGINAPCEPDEAGDLLFNIDHAVIQWCDGTQWIGFPKPPLQDPCADNPDPGTECADGSFYIGQVDGNNIYATAASEVTRTWNNGTVNFMFTGCDSDTNGQTNTDCLVNTSDAGAPYEAAEYCAGLEDVHGHSDWYLPAKDELNLFWNGGTPVAGVDTVGWWHWSSTEDSSSGAWVQRFSDGSQANFLSKANTVRVRCVRR